jgi:signal transduction histidine kinase
MMRKTDTKSRFRSSYVRVQGYIEELRKNPNAVKILTLKIVVLCFLIAAATSITIISQRRLEQAEYRLFESRFNSVSENALLSVTDSLRRMNLNIQEMSLTYGHVFPDIAQWPNVAWKGFHPTATLLSNVSSVGGMGILPIVRTSQVTDYQNFISGYYDTDPYCDRFTYFNPNFPDGEIWNSDNPTDDLPFQLFLNLTFSKAEEEVFTPLSQYTISSLIGPQRVNYNLYGDGFYTRTIDMVMNCTEDQEYNFASTSCGTISPSFPVPFPSEEKPDPAVDDMVAVFLHPIFPAENQTTLVGFAAGTFSWKALLTNVIPKDVSDIDCVIEADGKVFTFCIQDGIPVFVGEGALQESSYSDMRRSSSAILGQQIAVATGEPYVVSFYPTNAFQQQYQTERPKRGALVLFVSFLFCTILFGCYDFLRQREFDRNQAVLDTKRRFVRFISHEIRTPLNTVRLGMKLLEVEMGKFATALPSITAADVAGIVFATLSSWKQLADEIVESSESAVEVLNDLLNYDKIEIGTLKLELSYCNIRGLVERTVTAMQVQAHQKGIHLELNIPRPCEVQADAEDEEEGLDERTVVGDISRMGQVLRNLISNALKFTPSDGQVSISGTYLSGQPLSRC